MILRGETSRLKRWAFTEFPAEAENRLKNPGKKAVIQEPRLVHGAGVSGDECLQTTGKRMKQVLKRLHRNPQAGTRLKWNSVFELWWLPYCRRRLRQSG